jgi:enoyl-CoA hydratase/carnithine racemase
MNSLDRPTLAEGAKFIKNLHFDKDVRVVILTGTGNKAFCAGADLKEREGMSMSNVRQYIRTIRDTFTDIENLPMPVICAINGVALGGGLELALACDIRIASENAKLGLTEVTLGIIPGGGGTQRLPRLVGRGKAKEMLFLGQRITAPEAFDIGLINRITSEDKLMDVAIEVAEQIVNNPPIAVQQAKIAINRGMEVELAEGLEIESAAYEVCIPTKDRLEALAAFKEKRKPVFKGE